ncbi:MAG: (Fe-S)-binding protein [Dactylosporangium sp.]|nr:(Fe-S)-binding protein [Dactylosporangium sp.]NNJ61273.1 (Fe-S)-binding protein [Dactylosporangium sp.]
MAPVAGALVNTRVAMFVTCFNDTLFPQVGKATVRLLERLGVAVDVPQDQTCCGQMHFNSGYRAECVSLATRFAVVFSGYDAIVTPSASCASMVRHQYPIVARLGGADLSTRLEALPPVYELCEFLTDILGVTDVGASFPRRVVLHSTCHSVRLLGIGDRPRRLLTAVNGLDLVDPPGAGECCGFGGTFAVKNPDISVAMGHDKVSALGSTGASVLTSADTSCLLHLGGLLSRQDKPMQILHLAEILASTGERT